MPMTSLDEALAHPHIQARQMVQAAKGPEGEDIRVFRYPAKMSHYEFEVNRPPPRPRPRSKPFPPPPPRRNILP